ncbi:MAG: Sua5/YciO/YrdC/YwlC family protein [Planctomycetota bacterium]|nr:Sua5/YciO/YrdC/YwlC family protein [Planctomycetota bacterium]
MSAHILPYSGQTPVSAEIQSELLGLLERGEVVALPTETCYGLAVRADLPEPLSALSKLKGRQESQTFTWHVGRAETALPLAKWPALTKRLTDAFWPGPLTLVLPIEADQAKKHGLQHIVRDGHVGVRLPQHAATAELLASAPFPVVMTSANATGAPPMVRALDVAEAFGAQVAAVADGDDCQLGGSSTILALGPGRFELLRGGRISLEDLQSAAGLRLLFVCTGNTCRSPMAEGIARSRIAAALGTDPGGISAFGFRSSSAGVYASANAPVSPESVEVLAEWDIDIQDHTSTPSATGIAHGVDEIYGLTDGHVYALQQTVPDSIGDHVRMLSPSNRSIPDPIGGSVSLYRETRDAIAKAIDERLSQWL